MHIMERDSIHNSGNTRKWRLRRDLPRSHGRCLAVWERDSSRETKRGTRTPPAALRRAPPPLHVNDMIPCASRVARPWGRPRPAHETFVGWRFGAVPCGRTPASPTGAARVLRSTPPTMTLSARLGRDRCSRYPGNDCCSRMLYWARSALVDQEACTWRLQPFK